MSAESCRGGPICVVVGWAVFECSDVDDLVRVRDECAAIGSEIGVTMAVKQWGDIPRITDESGIRQEWRKLFANGESVDGEASDKSKIANMRMRNAVGAFKFLPTCDTPYSPGPYYVGDYNENVRTSARKRGPNEVPQYLHYVEKSDLDIANMADAYNIVGYVQPRQEPASSGHFPAVTLEKDGSNIHVTDSALERAISISASRSRSILEEVVTYVFDIGHPIKEKGSENGSTRSEGVSENDRTVVQISPNCVCGMRISAEVSRMG